MTEAAVRETPSKPFRPVLEVDYAQHRSRVSVFFRLLLIIPHLIWLYLVALVMYVVVFIGWFAALILGRLPGPFEGFLVNATTYLTRVSVYFWLLTDAYPPFWGTREYPARVEIQPGRLNRLAVLFRLFLIIPAYILLGIVSGGLAIAGFFIWLIVFLMGEMPRSLFDALVAVQRYFLRMISYGLLVTSAYPDGLLGDAPGAEQWTRTPPSEQTPAAPLPEGSIGVAPRPARGRLILSAAAKRIVVLLLVLGVLYDVGAIAFSMKTAASQQKVVDVYTDLANARNAFVARIVPFNGRLASCAAVSCVHASGRYLLEGSRTFETRLKTIKFPDAVRRERNGLEIATIAFSTIARQYATGSLATISQLDRVGSLRNSGVTFDKAYAELVRALASL